jgi:hypothetical protein
LSGLLKALALLFLHAFWRDAVAFYIFIVDFRFNAKDEITYVGAV